MFTSDVFIICVQSAKQTFKYIELLKLASFDKGFSENLGKTKDPLLSDYPAQLNGLLKCQAKIIVT